jgi:hypothetical protein
VRVLAFRRVGIYKSADKQAMYSRPYSYTAAFEYTAKNSGYQFERCEGSRNQKTVLPHAVHTKGFSASVLFRLSVADENCFDRDSDSSNQSAPSSSNRR